MGSADPRKSKVQLSWLNFGRKCTENVQNSLINANNNNKSFLKSPSQLHLKLWSLLVTPGILLTSRYPKYFTNSCKYQIQSHIGKSKNYLS